MKKHRVIKNATLVTGLSCILSFFVHEPTVARDIIHDKVSGERIGQATSNSIVKTSVFNIINFGEVPDGQRVNTKEIQASIDSCYRSGGGQVYVPAGTFVTGTIQLRDNVIFYLESGAVILMAGSEVMKLKTFLSTE